MQCPFCNSDNIEGVDQCARCGVDLSNASGLEERSEIELDLLHRPLGELMERLPRRGQDHATVQPDLPVRDVVLRLNQDGHHCAIVLDGEKIAGIFTERDVLNKLAHRFEAAAGEPVSDYMTPQPATLQADDPVAFGLNRMMIGGYRHIPIVREGKLAGVVSVRDILGYLLDRFGHLLPAETCP
jgi:CBS domain-containing protein